MMNGLSSEGRKNISGIKIGNAPTVFGERGGNRKRLYNERVVIIFLPFVSFLCPSCPRLCLLPTFLCTRKDRKKFAILIRMVGQQQRRLKLRLKNSIRVFQIKIRAENYNGKKKMDTNDLPEFRLIAILVRYSPLVFLPFFFPSPSLFLFD